MRDGAGVVSGMLFCVIGLPGHSALHGRVSGVLCPLRAGVWRVPPQRRAAVRFTAYFSVSPPEKVGIMGCFVIFKLMIGIVVRGLTA